MTEQSRKTLVSLLKSTADVLDLLAADEFRAKAYRNAARGLESVETELDELQATSFAKVPKVGKSIAGELMGYLQTGIFAPLEEAASQVPPEVMGLFRVRGLGPKKVRALWDAGIDSLEALREAARNGSLAKLKGFGAKSVATILEAVEFALAAQKRVHLSTGVEVVGQVAQWLAEYQPQPAGDMRRGLETVRSARLTVTATLEQVQSGLEGRLQELEVIEGKPLITGRLDGVLVEVAYASAQTRGALDLMMGGSNEYREDVRAIAQAAGYDLSGRGLVKKGELIAASSEQEICSELGLKWRPTEYREPEHERIWEQLPSPAELIQVSDLRGMLHTHSTWSDGATTVQNMVAKAVELGHEYLGTGDHSQSAAYAGGMSIPRLREHIAEVRELQAAGVPVIAGAEVDILEDGSLDYPDDVLAELDYVVGSVHSLFTLDADRQTARLVKAVSHPLITILGHPTGRLLLRRPGYALDLNAVLEACQKNQTVVEINANPYRLDLDWRMALQWRNRLKFAINTDAHVPGGLQDTYYGVAVARKAGLGPTQVINTLTQQQFLDFVQTQRINRARL